MEKALFLKEWLKTRYVFWLCLIAGIAMAIYVYMNLSKISVMKGAEHVYQIMLLKDQTFATILMYFPLIAGLAIGAAQIFPEMLQKRLKLTLHLPVSIYKSIGWMLGTGYIELIIIFLIQIIAIIFIYSGFVAPELVKRVVFTTIPWYTAGFVTYCFTAAICFEGTLYRRIILALVGIIADVSLFLCDAPEGYNPAFWMLALLVILLPLLSFNSVFRFKEGRQD